MKHVLVCGGAGYIGAHMVKRLLHDGCRVTVYDNLSTGHREAVFNVELVVGDILDQAAVARLLDGADFDAVMHFGARSLVAESISDPCAYYRNNVLGTINLLEAMRRADIDRFIFSSSAAVYGVPAHSPVQETDPTAPINPYGASKLMVERVLQDAAHAYGLRSVALRYFNAAGADFDGELGESHSPETHLIPNVLCSALDDGAPLLVFGSDYDTRDGTCLRDYVHVNDLAEAHLQAMDYLDTRPGAHYFNLGNGSGYTVMEVIDAARRITGKPIAWSHAPRRPGDPPALVASSGCAMRELGWQPVYSDLEQIIGTAWRWHCAPRF